MRISDVSAFETQYNSEQKHIDKCRNKMMHQKMQEKRTFLENLYFRNMVDSSKNVLLLYFIFCLLIKLIYSGKERIDVVPA